MWRQLLMVAPLVAGLAACTSPSTGSDSAPMGAAGPCSDDWYAAVEKAVMTGDAQAHGPDIGSPEWQSAVEFRLGVRGHPGLPARDTQAWCDYIQQRLEQSGPAVSAAPVAPSFDCSAAEADSIPARICANPALSRRDLQLAAVYAAAQAKAVDEQPPTLAAEQRGWIKGRDDCWKAEEVDRCVADAYERRMAELQARYRLVSWRGPVAYGCNGDTRNELVITWFYTHPQTVLAERGDSSSILFSVPSGSGSRYEGRNESFWEHGGEAQLVWGFEAEPMTCRPLR